MINKHLTIKSMRVAYFLLGCLILIGVSFYGAWKLTLPSKMCAVCHMMKPEYYTWMASGHEDVNCISCHYEPGPIDFFKGSAGNIKHAYAMAAGKYVSPIIKLSPLSDDACERCHKVSDKTSVKTKDLVVAHGKHKKAQVTCHKCHDGIAHGNIAKRKVTFEGDYQKWNALMGETLMNDPKFIKPSMGSCIRCHELRKVTRECKTCHPSGKKPKSHNVKEYNNIGHGKASVKNINGCDLCHHFMSEKPIEVLKEEERFKEFLGQERPKNNVELAIAYARVNTFCRDCHSKRPPGHQEPRKNIETHGILAQKDNTFCYTCHNQQGDTGPTALKNNPELIAKRACSECHPSAHYKSVQWGKGYHPTPLPKNPKLEKSCYTCHSIETCGKCHGEFK